MLLSEKADNSRNNNLDLIRLIAASLVIWSHAYPIVKGKGAEQPLNGITNGQMSLGDLGVAIFFILSGFLVSQSMFRLNDLTDYIKARVLRIFPGLIFCIALSLLIIGPIFTTLSLPDYFTNNATYGYLFAATTLNFLSPFLPGVFESNPYGAFVNGSLWTLKYELICYFALALSWKLGLLQRSRVFVALIACIWLYCSTSNDHLENLAKLSLYFFAGALFYLYRHKTQLNYKIALACAAALATSNQLGLLNLAFSVFGGYIIIYLGYRWPEAFNCTKHGDLSYGMYIYGWPSQQILIATFPEMSVLQNIIYSIGLAAPLAYISWHCIEKPFMRMRKYRFSNLVRIKKSDLQGID